ncbi:MAG: hypothetical protein AB1413_12615 [Thermodesulfobacteriota bacterium]
MIALLAEKPQPTYPADYLLARLPARRQRWEAVFAPRSDDPASSGWGAMAAEFRWLYGQLHRRLRQELAPLFVYFELRPLFLFLRGLEREGEACRALLPPTLLAEEVKRVLPQARDAAAAVRLLAGFWPAGAALERLHAAGGPAAVEQEMTRQVLAAGARSSVALRGFWGALIDLENLMALAKRRRWRAEQAFGYGSGGTIAPRRLVAAGQGATSLLRHPLAAMVDRAVQEGAWPLEDVLIERVRQQLRRLEDPLAPAAAVAAYMWGAHATTRRLAMMSGREAAA